MNELELLGLVIGIVMCFINGIMADSKGYNWLGFGLVSLLNWFIPFLILLFLPDNKEKN